MRSGKSQSPQFKAKGKILGQCSRRATIERGSLILGLALGLIDGAESARQEENHDAKRLVRCSNQTIELHRSRPGLLRLICMLQANPGIPSLLDGTAGHW
jgi:hypothetical protein